MPEVIEKTPELEMLEKVSKQVEDYQKKLGNKIDKEDLKVVTEALQELKNGTVDKKTVEDLKEVLSKFQLRVEEIQEELALNKDKGGSSIKGYKSLGQLVIDKIIADKFDLTKVADRQGAAHYNAKLDSPMVRKVPATMTTANVDAVGTDSIPFELADFEFGLTRIARRTPYLLQVANTSPISTMYAQWAEQENLDGSAAAVAEGNLKPQIDFDWVEKSAKVEKIAAWIKVSKEMLADLPGLRNELDTELAEKILLKTDDDLWDGNGTSPNIKGITEFAQAFSVPAGLAGTISSKVEAIIAAMGQIMEDHFMPSIGLVNPIDVLAMNLEKTPDGHYKMPPFRSADGTVIAGVRLVENLGVPTGEFLVGDFSKWRVRIREGFNIDVGLVNDDFIRNLVTILGEIRLVSYVKSNHLNAFVHGTYEDAIDAPS